MIVDNVDDMDRVFGRTGDNFENDSPTTDQSNGILAFVFSFELLEVGTFDRSEITLVICVRNLTDSVAVGVDESVTQIGSSFQVECQFLQPNLFESDVHASRPGDGWMTI